MMQHCFFFCKTLWVTQVYCLCKYLAHTPPPVGMATVGQLRWAGSLTCLTQSPARLGTVCGNVRQKKWWAYCWVTCLFSSLSFPQANQFTLDCSTENASWLSWASLSLYTSVSQCRIDKNPIGWPTNLTSASHLTVHVSWDSQFFVEMYNF